MKISDIVETNIECTFRVVLFICSCEEKIGLNLYMSQNNKSL